MQAMKHVCNHFLKAAKIAAGNEQNGVNARKQTNGVFIKQLCLSYGKLQIMFYTMYLQMCRMGLKMSLFLPSLATVEEPFTFFLC